MNGNERCFVRHRSTVSESVDVDSNFIKDRLCCDDLPRHAAADENGRGVLRSNFFGFFWAELTRGYALENDEARFSEKRRKVYAFIKIPKELEKFLFYGFLQCTDAFLYIFTFLPLRFFMALMHLIWAVVCRKSTSSLSPSETCDLVRVLILTVVSLLMSFIDVSVVYHLVRGQAVIKLYIFFNMLEVADKLFSSFGQDILDTLFWTATETDVSQDRGSGRMRDHRYFGTVPHLLLAIVYVFLHSLLVLLQATTLNVAFNSHNKALLTIMISNNFVELKGSVFKRFAKNNLFQMACSDVRERFHYFVLLQVVVLRNMSAVSWRAEHFCALLPDIVLMLFGEVFVDWLKHAFITKFNEIPFDIYRDFSITLACDVVTSRQKNAFSDHFDQVSRRMGFIPLPLSVLYIRILCQTVKWTSRLRCLILVLLFANLVLLKLLNSIVLLGKAVQCVDAYQQAQEQAKKKPTNLLKCRSLSTASHLNLIEFSDVLQQTHSDAVRFAAFDGRLFVKEYSFNATCEQRDVKPTDLPPLLSQRRAQSLMTLPCDSNSAKELNEQVKTEVESGSEEKLSQSVINEYESLKDVDRYTLCNNDRIES
ncbi:unnamed protein product [Soboliphyme baturini]|uniref:Protein TAPT1 homolog n=1 Tax=Soboliphyme baturini TaxID=241478 RepID=A0A183IQ21_9BILA|nr:unnamed protein product [Soboliphyme baturini]